MRIFASLLCVIAPALLGCASDVQSGGVAGGGECSDYLPRTPTWAKATVRLRNSTGATLYLGSSGGCAFDPFTLKDPKGEALKWQLAPCEQTCVAQQNGSCACAADCAIPPVFLIPPGGAFETTWEGSIFAKTNMPAACFRDPMCAAGGCLFEQAAPEGALEVQGTLWDSIAGCPMGMGACTCDPGTAGSCQIPAPVMVGGMQRTASAKLSYPGATQVEILFP
jgi:hypothetical protein